MKIERIVRFISEGQVYYGRQYDEEIRVLEGDIFGNYRENGRAHRLGDVKILAPCQPTKAVCVGLNYGKHAAEFGMKVPEDPVIFLKPSTSLIGPEEDIVYWPGIGRLDYEGELVVVIGKRAHRVKPEEAEQYIFGYTAGNDVTARDLQQKDGQWTRGKGFDTFMPLGPAIVRGIDVSRIKVQSYLNGELKQDGSTADLITSVPQLVSYISNIMTLLPGDVIMTGTPEGVGPMQPRDRIEVRIEGIGSLVNKVCK